MAQRGEEKRNSGAKALANFAITNAKNQDYQVKNAKNFSRLSHNSKISKYGKQSPPQRNQDLGGVTTKALPSDFRTSIESPIKVL